MPSSKAVAADTKVAEDLCRILADTYAVYLKTHGYHWNVRGPQFSSLHALFMGQYTEMWTALDELAERVRALGELAPMSYKAFANLSSIRDGDAEQGSDAMVAELQSDNEAVCAMLKTGIASAEAAKDGATADLLTTRLAAHEKHVWMLRSTLGAK